MSNMSHCRFENILNDLEDCYEHMEDENLNKYEEKARKKLIKLCYDIVSDFEDEIED